MASALITVIKDNNFESEVLKSNVPVLVDFWAEWCGPCRMIAPLLDELANEFSGKLKIAKVNVDENPELSSKYGIRAIPTLLIIKNGQVHSQMVGASSKKDLQNKINAALV